MTMIASLLNQVGGPVTITGPEGTHIAVRALVQPASSPPGENRRPEPLGWKDTRRFIYMGPPGVTITPQHTVRWLDEDFRVISIKPWVWGGTVAYLWALLERKADSHG